MKILALTFHSWGLNYGATNGQIQLNSKYLYSLIVLCSLLSVGYNSMWYLSIWIHTNTNTVLIGCLILYVIMRDGTWHSEPHKMKQYHNKFLLFQSFQPSLLILINIFFLLEVNYISQTMFIFPADKRKCVD